VNKYITGSVIDTTIQPDVEVMDQVRVMFETFPCMLANPTPSAVDFDDDSQILEFKNGTKTRISSNLTDLIPLDGRLAATLLESVIEAVSRILYGSPEFCISADNDEVSPDAPCSKDRENDNRKLVDSSLFEALLLVDAAPNGKYPLRLRVPKQLFSPLRQLLPSYVQHHPQHHASLPSSAATDKGHMKEEKKGVSKEDSKTGIKKQLSQSSLFSFCRAKDSLKSLAQCLHVKFSEPSGRTMVYSFSLQQYYNLLDIFGTT
jgi:hypothetical protein